MQDDSFIFQQVLVITILMAFFVIVSASVFAAGVRDLAGSRTNRSLDLNLSALEAASVSTRTLIFSFQRTPFCFLSQFFAVLGAVAYTGDVILEIIALVFAIIKIGVEKLYLGSCCLKET